MRGVGVVGLRVLFALEVKPRYASDDRLGEIVSPVARGPAKRRTYLVLARLGKLRQLGLVERPYVKEPSLRAGGYYGPWKLTLKGAALLRESK